MGHVPSADRRRRGQPLVARVVFIALAVLVFGIIVALIGARHAVLASLPQTTGSRALPGLRAPVRVDRDSLGIPTIRGANRLDVARATGFVHAQERFFEMDLARRFAAGELSDLAGSGTLVNDRKYRVHRLRQVAREVLARASPTHRALLQAYADGVNAGLASLGARPPEYLVLRAQPAAWRPEDSVLIVGAMFANDLQNARLETELGALYARVPSALADFLRPLGDEWDAPLVGAPMTPPPMPGADTFDVRRNPAKAESDATGPGAEDQTSAGLQAAFSTGFGASNSWAIDAAHTADGHAIVANDPHLPVTVPDIWFRLSLEFPDDAGVVHRLSGASVPGLPFVAIGSNGHVAWGFTVAFDDRSDMVVVEPAGQGGEMYATPEGPRRLEHHVEWIKVKGAPDERLDVSSTIWGPIVGRDARGRPLAQQWQGHHPDGLDVTFAEMETATSVEQALDVANRSGMPSYNIVVADEHGSIGWTVTGRLPRRVGFDGRLPSSWADGSHRWDGWLDVADYPRVINPPSGRIWTCNNRLVDGAALDRLGREGFIMGPRARQVRDGLMAIERATPRDSLNIQIDDRALFLDRWRAFLLDRLTERSLVGHPERREFRRVVDHDWHGRASVSSAGYLLVRDFRFQLAQLVIGPLIGDAKDHALHPGAIIEWWESALWRLVHETPRHLLEARWRDWDAVVMAAIDATISQVNAKSGSRAAATWGKTTGHFSHPLSRGVPWLARWLDLPWVELPGDVNMPRVRMPSEAGEVSATLRMVVAPGHEETGIFEMPGGQSGHPASPHYRDQYAGWVEGRATPFLPGKTVETLLLEPPAKR